MMIFPRKEARVVRLSNTVFLFLSDSVFSFEMLRLLTYVEQSREENAKYFLLSAEKHPVYSNKLCCKYYATEPIRISSLA